MKRLVLVLVAMLQTLLIFGQSRSSSEVFVEIPERGNYVVYLDDDFAGSAKGRFRFYEVYRSIPTLIVMKDSQEVFRKRINVPANTRMLFSYSKRSGLRNVVNLPVFDRGQYALDNWDRSFSNNNGDEPIGHEVMTTEEHAKLMEIFKREPFEQNQLKLIKAAVKTNLMTTKQLITFLNQFYFDSKKLELAKYAYPYIADPKNFVAVTETLDFQSSKDQIFALMNKE